MQLALNLIDARYYFITRSPADNFIYSFHRDNITLHLSSEKDISFFGCSRDPMFNCIHRSISRSVIKFKCKWQWSKCSESPSSTSSPATRDAKRELWPRLFNSSPSLLFGLLNWWKCSTTRRPVVLRHTPHWSSQVKCNNQQPPSWYTVSFGGEKTVDQSHWTLYSFLREQTSFLVSLQPDRHLNNCSNSTNENWTRKMFLLYIWPSAGLSLNEFFVRNPNKRDNLFFNSKQL